MVVFSIINFGQASIEEGNNFYELEQYEKAVNEYSSLIADEKISSDLFYNLGNAYYRNKEIGKAIWAYESSLKLDPDHADALFNLEFVNAQTIDKIDISRQGFGHWLSGILFSENINFWAYLSVFSSFLLSLCVILYTKSKKGKNRNFLVLGALSFGLILLVSIVVSGLHKERLISKHKGVVISETTAIKMSPLDSAKTSFSLGAGAKIELIETKDDWVQIEINGNKGWVIKESIWEI